ncbi:unnamed protein product [Amoebophrya sp. A120]|nr:unnamed protein product [Amoebophrya sp. A120]|eukprot:GSA120T00009097001.1
MIDIAFNITDEAFHGRGKYDPDLDLVIQRAVEADVEAFVICGGNNEDCKKSLEICAQYDPIIGTTNEAANGCAPDESPNGTEILPSSRRKNLKLFQTIGIHPTRCSDFDPEVHLAELRQLIEQNRERVVAWGEFGLDYDRLHFCDKEKQQFGFRMQVRCALSMTPEKFFPPVASSQNKEADHDQKTIINSGEDHAYADDHYLPIPFYLHCRGEGCWPDLVEILEEEKKVFAKERTTTINKALEDSTSGGTSTTSCTAPDSISPSPLVTLTGVVHSFTGSLAEMREIVDSGFEIGINGCSLKTEDNCAVVKEIPLQKLHLETDCPYCDIRPTHFSHQFLQKLMSTSSKSTSKSSQPGRTAGPTNEQEIVLAGEKEDENLTKARQVLESFPVSKKKLERGMMLKSRNEPCRMIEVAEVIAGLKGISSRNVVEQCTKNSKRLFRI